MLTTRALRLPLQAKLWNLPVVFTCENNKYGMGTSAERSSMNTEYFKRGDVIAGIQVRPACPAARLWRAAALTLLTPLPAAAQINGMDILACYQASKFAKQWAADDKGPLLAEFVTYRYGGHS